MEIPRIARSAMRRKNVQLPRWTIQILTFLSLAWTQLYFADSASFRNASLELNVLEEHNHRFYCQIPLLMLWIIFRATILRYNGLCLEISHSGKLSINFSVSNRVQFIKRIALVCCSGWIWNSFWEPLKWYLWNDLHRNATNCRSHEIRNWSCRAMAKVLHSLSIIIETCH